MADNEQPGSVRWTSGYSHCNTLCNWRFSFLDNYKTNLLFVCRIVNWNWQLKLWTRTVNLNCKEPNTVPLSGTESVHTLKGKLVEFENYWSASSFFKRRLFFLAPAAESRYLSISLSLSLQLYELVFEACSRKNIFHLQGKKANKK